MFPRLRSAGLHAVPLCEGVQRRMASTDTPARQPPPPSPSPASSSSPPASGKSMNPKRHSILPKNLVTDWTPGINYYFSREEEERFMTPCVVDGWAKRESTSTLANSKNGVSSSTTTEGGDAGVDHAKSIVPIKGTFRGFHVDTSIPPLREEEVARWRLESLPIMKGLALRRRAEGVREITLLPIDAMVTYLGEDVRRLDQAYRIGGYYTVSEVAEVLFHYVPTFSVELPRVLNLIPESLRQKMEADMGTENLGLHLFSRYPMLFDFMFRRFNSSCIRLNSSYWFVRQHPNYGKADAALRKYKMQEQISFRSDDVAVLPSGSTASVLAKRKDGVDQSTSTGMDGAPAGAAASSNSRLPFSVKMFQTLVRNLPHYPTPPSHAATAATVMYKDVKDEPFIKNRYAAFNVLQWVESFSPEDKKLFKNVPEQNIFRVLALYVRVFQLVSRTASDTSLFVEGDILLAAHAKRRATRQSRGSLTAIPATAGTENDQSTEAANTLDDEEDDDGMVFNEEQEKRAASVRARGEGTESVNTSAVSTEAGKTSTRATGALSSDEATRSRQAIADDLIGLDELFSDPDHSTEGEEPAAREGGTAASSSTAIRYAEDARRVAQDEALADNDDDKPFTVDDDDYEGGQAGEFDDDDDEAFDAHDRDQGSSRPNNNSSSSNEGESARFNGVDRGERNGSAQRGMRGPLPAGASVEDDLTVFGLPLEDVYVRRLPPDVAPRSLSDWDENTSPDVELAALAARYLAPPPTLTRTNQYNNFFTRSAQHHSPFDPPLALWRWVSVERLYHGYTDAQRHHLRREYKGLVNFLRYHGKLFELSDDLLYVIAHDPEGKLPPIPFMERRFFSDERVVLPRTFDDDETQSAALVGENERAIFSRVAGEGRVPASRRHLLLLDGNNPILLPEVLHEEIANLLPDHPMRLSTVLMKLPPVLRAALPHRANFNASKYLETFLDRGITMVRRRAKVGMASVLRTKDRSLMSVEEAVAELLQAPLEGDGVTLSALRHLHLSAGAVNTLCDHYGSLQGAVRAYPQYFTCEKVALKKKEACVVKFRK